jgi:hypothetical protein
MASARNTNPLTRDRYPFIIARIRDGMAGESVGAKAARLALLLLLSTAKRPDKPKRSACEWMEHHGEPVNGALCGIFYAILSNWNCSRMRDKRGSCRVNPCFDLA